MLTNARPTNPPNYHPEDADFGPSHDEVTAELLTLTRNFFHQASPAVREELRQFLTNQGHLPSPAWKRSSTPLQFNAGHHRNPNQPPDT